MDEETWHCDNGWYDDPRLHSTQAGKAAPWPRYSPAPSPLLKPMAVFEGGHSLCIIRLTVGGAEPDLAIYSQQSN